MEGHPIASEEEVATGPAERGGAGEVFAAFLKLGLTSFGGPIAHIGYFRDEFVRRRRWLDDAAFGELMALCQFLPGPASSQLGFAIGLRRAGFAGALAAWTAFTLPSALLMFALALYQPAAAGPLIALLVHSLKLVAAAIVAQAVVQMGRSLAPDLPRAVIAAMGLACVAAGAAGQIIAIILGGLAGLWLCRAPEQTAAPAASASFSKRLAVLSGTCFLLLLFGLPLAASQSPSPALDIAAIFYRAGALVFGGGHVVLPLLEQGVVTGGMVGSDAFLAGYGAAQALPGPLFAFAAYLGGLAGMPGDAVGTAFIALIAIFLPGMLILLAALPFWTRVRMTAPATAAVRGINAAVVGILAAALYDPVWTGGVETARDALIVAGGFVMLMVWKLPPWLVVVMIIGAATGLGAIGVR